MALAYNAPGVYVREEPGGARPIGAVGTSTAGFVGVAPNADAPTDRAVDINNWTEFRDVFAPMGTTTSTPLANAVYCFFANGGGRCYVVHVPDGSGVGGADPRSGLGLLRPIDEIAIVAAPGFTDFDTYEAVLSHCESLEDRVAILDGPATADDVEALTRAGSSGVPARPSRRRSSAAPSEEGESGEAEEPDLPAVAGGDGLRPRDSAYGSFYFPHIVVNDPITNTKVAVPPSGHLAGIWARTDV